MDNNEILNDVVNQLDSLMGQIDKTLNNLPIEVVQKTQSARIDFLTVKNSIKNGDFTKINELQKKYANHNK